MDYNEDQIGRKVASMLLEIEAIKFNIKKPFKWSSGWNSPIYCDNRLSLSHPQIRSYIKMKLTEAVRFHFKEAEAIAGVATAGIPQGTLIADQLDLPFSYVRSKTKEHGMENLIEGKVGKKQKIVVFEDLVSTGKSSLQAVDALLAAKAEVIGMVAIFTYGFPIAQKKFEEKKVKLVTLSNYKYLLEEAREKGKVTDQDLVALKAWKVDPEGWTS